MAKVIESFFRAFFCFAIFYEANKNITFHALEKNVGHFFTPNAKCSVKLLDKFGLFTKKLSNWRQSDQNTQLVN